MPKSGSGVTEAYDPSKVEIPVQIRAPASSPEPSTLDGVESWHNGCGGFAGRTRVEVEEHLRSCREGGQTVHFHKLNPKVGSEKDSGFTVTLSFRRKP